MLCAKQLLELCGKQVCWGIIDTGKDMPYDPMVFCAIH